MQTNGRLSHKIELRGKHTTTHGVVEFVDTESLVSEGHLLRKADRAVDFGRLYEIVERLYSEDEGQRSIDPVVLFKIVLLQHLDGTPSLRGTLRKAQTDIAYRWFLGYTLNGEPPHFSTVSYNFRHCFTQETIEAVYRWILDEAESAGAPTPAAVFIDGTHIKASANLNQKIKQEVPVAAERYRDELLAEINADREGHGKKPFHDDDDPPRSAGKERDNASKKKLAYWKSRRPAAPFRALLSLIVSSIYFTSCLVRIQAGRLSTGWGISPSEIPYIWIYRSIVKLITSTLPSISLLPILNPHFSV